MGGKIEELLGDPIQLTECLRKAVEEADSFKQDCTELNEKVAQLANLLRTAARIFSHGSRNLYECPTRRIMAGVSKTLDKVLVLVKKCKRTGMLKRVVNIISTTDFRKANNLLDAAIGDVKWLLNVCAYTQDGRRGGMEGLPPIASTDPMLAWVWEQIALVHGGTPAEKEEGASYLTSLASDNDRNRKLIIEEGGVGPLLRLLKEGTSLKGRMAAVNALCALASDEERVRQIHEHGAASVFVHILQDGQMKLQAKIAWAIAKMASLSYESQLFFSSDNIIRALVSLLVFETIDRNNSQKNFRSNTMHSVVRNTMALNSSVLEGKLGHHQIKTIKSHNGRGQDQWDSYSTYSEFYIDGQWDGICRSPEVIFLPETKPRQIRHSRGFSDSYYFHGFSNRELIRKERENEDPATKRELKIQVTSALWKLAENNVKNSRRITDTKALICLAKMIEKETGEVQKNSVMAVLEIAASAERDPDLRRFAFKTNSQAAKAVVDQLLRIIESGEPDLQVPCLKAIGCLSRTFPAKETQVIEPLVHQLGHSENAVAGEAAIALRKFVLQSNFLHVEHSKTIIEANAVPHLMQMVSMDDVQIPALSLLCLLALHMGSSDVFQETDTLKMLKTLSCSNSPQIHSDGSLKDLILNAIHHLELYQSAPRLFSQNLY